jgi:hypothetical protein
MVRGRDAAHEPPQREDPVLAARLETAGSWRLRVQRQIQLHAVDPLLWLSRLERLRMLERRVGRCGRFSRGFGGNACRICKCSRESACHVGPGRQRRGKRRGWCGSAEHGQAVPLRPRGEGCRHGQRVCRHEQGDGVRRHGQDDATATFRAFA